MRTTATVAVLFCDVVGSTERLTRLGDEAGDQFRRELFAALRRAVVENGGTEVKHLGDGLMVVFERSSIDAIECAAAMHAAAAAVDPDDPVHLRIGISIGEVAHEDDDWFGTPVVEAARLCAAAGPDRTLAPALLDSIVGSRARSHRFRPVGQMSLKGLPPGMEVVEIDGPEDPDREIVPRSVPRADAAAVGVGGRRRWPLFAAGLAVVAVVALVATLLINDDGGDDVRADGDGRGDRVRSSDVVTTPEGYVPRLVDDVPCSQEMLDKVPTAVCKELVVPEWRAKPDARKLRLPVTFVAGPPDSDVDPVVVYDVNEGAATALADSADVYLLTVRGFHTGTGESLPSHHGADPVLKCPDLLAAWLPTLEMRADDPGAVQVRADAAEACRDDLATKAQLEGYTWVEGAADIRDLVFAADLGRVNVAAGGLTTVAAVAFARANPGSVESMLLTNPTPPGRSILEDPTLTLSRTFVALQELCAADEECRTEYGDLEAKYEQRYEQLQASPVIVETTPIKGGPPVRVLLDGRRYAAALESAMRESTRLPQLPSAVAGAEGQTPEQLDELTAAAGIAEELTFFAGQHAGAFLSLTCSYDVHTNRTASVSDLQLEEYAGANDPTFAEICQRWGAPDEYERLSRPLDADIPVLIAYGGLSASGANGWGDQMAERLKVATVVEVPTKSEDLAFAPPRCLIELRAQFLADPFAPLDPDACEDVEPVEFIVG
jgi:class 3 adenylate cyclase/pimeloyl-ACP methyl ester carboxylesterase